MKDAQSMKVYPVIHYLGRATTMVEIAIARSAGAHGVFLIDHHGDDDELVDVAIEAKLRNSNFPIGINLLSRSPQEAARHAVEAELDMVWADSMGVSSRGLNELGESLSHFAAVNPALMMFAGVAFKYQAPEPDPASAAQHATKAGFIATTSGAATGSAPELAKIKSMYEAGGRRLAVASGMTPENIGDFAPFLSHCLVATGIGFDDHHIDRDKLVLFINNARATVAAAPVVVAHA